jgi:hypothetical protein
MAWLDLLADIEDLEDAQFDAELIAQFETAAAATNREARPIRFSTPTFKEYETTELSGCNKNSFPAFSMQQEQLSGVLDHSGSLRAELRPLPEEDSRAHDSRDQT